MRLEPGMRVRCVDAEWHTELTDGSEYIVAGTFEACGIGRVRLQGHPLAYYARRFKPILRVKAPTRRELLNVRAVLVL
jgi:hypothetical protein